MSLHRRNLRRQLEHGGKEELQEARGRLERLSSMVVPGFSENVAAHFRQPQHQEKEGKDCIECKERVEEGMAVKKHCMVFHANCWETVREGFFHRKRYLKCALCGKKVVMEMV